METIRFDYLNTLLTVARTHSFSTAAKELGTTQGTVSYQIAALRDYFDAELFKRTANGVEVTTSGAILAEAAVKILAEVEHTKVEISSAKRKLTGVIRISVSTVPGEHIMPSLIAGFQAKYHDIRLKIRSEDSINSLLNVQNGEVDFAAVGTMKGYSDKLEAIEVAEEQLVLIVPNGHELANRESVKLNDILRYPYINREETSGTRREIERMFEEAGISPSKLKTRLELASTESIITAVSESRGAAIISSIASRKAQAASLVKVVRIEGVDSTRKLYIARAKKPLIRASEIFWDFCKKYTSHKKAKP